MCVHRMNVMAVETKVGGFRMLVAIGGWIFGVVEVSGWRVLSSAEDIKLVFFVKWCGRC